VEATRGAVYTLSIKKKKKNPAGGQREESGPTREKCFPSEKRTTGKQCRPKLQKKKVEEASNPRGLGRGRQPGETKTKIRGWTAAGADPHKKTNELRLPRKLERCPRGTCKVPRLKTSVERKTP